MAKTAAEVWTEFKPKLAAAREEDRAGVALSFLPIIIPLGRFEIVPLTIEKLLWLEQIESPFVNGAEPRRADVLAFLWICSPSFRIGEKYGKRFCWNNCLIQWRKYANLISEYMQEIAEAIGGESSDGTIDPNWLPQTVDAFASQYHWTSKEIMEMPVHRSSVLANAINARLSENKSQVTFSPNSDRVRNEMMKAIRAEEEKKNGQE